LTGYRNLHRYALFTACCTFCLLIAGGLVTSTQSGLSVPDWPNTYGHFMFAYPLDQMVGGIFYEHSHRMIASVVGFLTVVLAFWLWKREDRRWVRNLGLVAVVAVCLQGLLGGLTVRFLLPPAISVSHATLAQTFFSIIASLALVTSPWWRAEHPMLRPAQGIPVTRVAMIAAAAVFLQLILGAVMRHLHAGLSVPDLPLAYGQLFPALDSDALARYNRELVTRDLRLSADDPYTAAQIAVHMAHRYWAVVTAGLVGWLAVRLIRLGSESGRLRTLGIVLAALVLLQVSLGVATVLSLKAVDLTTAHVATGALLLVVCVLSTLHSVRLTQGARGAAPSAARVSPRGVTA
jgi:cytochrome c oxidase assembly protein subunit 15